ncbi:hypothetical protein C8R47DRAFT_1328095 [Mycena vitilis]|nr:hypothetical protein C8R47DRAFT_1328095 [Mycena vitilis]
MQCRILVALAVSILTLTVSAAPVPSSSILDPAIQQTPSVALGEVARESNPTAEAQPGNETEEPRACRLFYCI